MGSRSRQWRRRRRFTRALVVLVALFVSTTRVETTAASTSVPSAPTWPSAVPGNAQATVTWTAPANNGSTITGYVITTYVGTNALAAQPYNSAATTETVTGLTNATTYTFKI
ncbi:MAG: large repetitive protein, partial [Actinomycetota bacterium]|nr:large repetitive protein [Actinomycetota bacterium]